MQLLPHPETPNVIKKLVCKLPILLAIVGLCGCATISHGTSQLITFKLEPIEIVCSVSRDGDGQIGRITQSNNSLIVSRDKDDIVVECAATGYIPKTVRLVSLSTAKKGMGIDYAGLILLGLAVGDAVTGALWKYPESTNIALEKE
jgi:hypothetical protein